MVIRAETSERKRLAGLVKALDQPRGHTNEIIKVIHLQYADAAATAEVLGPISEKLMANRRDAAPQAEGASGGQTSAETRKVNIQADESIHAIVLHGPPEVVEMLEDLTGQLDIPRRQVMIQALIAEISTDRSSELGVQWGLNDSVGDGSISPLGGVTFSGANPSLSAAASSPTSLGNGLALGVVDGTSTILGTQIVNFRLLLRALAGDADNNVLSAPSLIVENNKEAEIVVGQNVPFVTGSFTSTGNGSTPDNPFQTIERQDVGLTLKVKPRIAAQGVVQMNIDQQVSSISTSSVGASDLITNKRSIKTDVTVRDGHIIALGGLMDDNLQESVQKVPGLGDLPLLGGLFRYQSSNIVKRNLMVFIRPEILTNQADADRATLRHYNTIRAKQVRKAEQGILLQSGQSVPELPELNSATDPVNPETDRLDNSAPTPADNADAEHTDAQTESPWKDAGFVF